MLREHAPLIAVAVVTAVLIYLVFRELRSLRGDVELLNSQVLLPSPEPPEPESPPSPDSPGSAQPAQRAARQRQAASVAQAAPDPTATPAASDASKPASKRV